MLDFNDTKKPKLHFLSHIFPANAADLNYNPLQYFKEFLSEYQCVRHRWDAIEYDLISPTDWVIIGGGDLYNPRGDEIIDRLLLWTGGRLVSWGCGYNIKDGEPESRMRKKNFALFTTREYGYNSAFGSPERYVPCPSCMMEGLSAQGAHSIKRRIGIVEHKSYPVSMQGSYCKISNSLAVEQILEFMRTSEIIATNSYHASYWAVLMNKPLLRLPPYLRKFEHSAYPLVCYSGDLESDLAKIVTYPGALEECRRLNRGFCKDVLAAIRADDRRPGAMLSAFIDIFRKLRGKKVAVKGAGLHTKMLLKLMEGYFRPECICRRGSAADDVSFEYPFVDESKLEEYGVDAIVVSSYKWRDDIRREMLNLPRRYEIFDIYDELAKKNIHLRKEFYEHECADEFWKDGMK